MLPALDKNELEPTIAVSVTTYKKPRALRGWLDSVLSNFGPVIAVNIADDNNGECAEIAQEYQPLFKQAGIHLSYSTGANKGIAGNKNRGLKFFIEDPVAQKCNFLLLTDDDIAFTTAPQEPLKFDDTEYVLAPYFSDMLIEAYQQTKPSQITGYLGGTCQCGCHWLDPGSKRPYFDQFPPVMEDKFLLYCEGSQGLILFFTREAVMKTGYFDIFPTRYGYEHVLYSARVNRVLGHAPTLFPILKNCHHYFHCQGISNGYAVVPEEQKKNQSFYKKRLEQVIAGVNLVVKNSGV